MSSDNVKNLISRREFISLAGCAAAAPLIGYANDYNSVDQIALGSTKSTEIRKKQPNVLFVFTDQERFFDQYPKGFELPGHERLKNRGISFNSHYCPAVMCTSSRAVLLTGLQTPDNRMFENADMPYVKALSTKIPSIGHMLRKAGYYTAYKGKWHLNREFETAKPTHLFTNNMDAYGFSDFELPYDGLAHASGGYMQDQRITSGAITWMRENGQQLNAQDKPWALFVSLINPHDIMYFNTDLPGQSVQDNGRLLMHAARAPDYPSYRKSWDAKLSPTLMQPFLGRPSAHLEFDKAWSYALGRIPMEADRWKRFNDFYLNSIQAVDAQLSRLVDELDSLGLFDNTIVVFTSDHGEMGGAHGLRGKGPFAYQEAIHLPLIISHPDAKSGKECTALTGHIDLAPTLLSMCGVSKDRSSDYAGRELPGKDFSALFNKPNQAETNEINEAVLFTYSGLATNDSELIRIIADAKANGKDPKSAVKDLGYKPNMKKRGSLRSAFDGRYKFTRYFSPIERNRPTNLDDLYRFNDVELFDLKTDPAEVNNLAMNREQNSQLILTMSEKLEAQIKTQIGVDNGREMPNIDGIKWQIDQVDL